MAERTKSGSSGPALSFIERVGRQRARNMTRDAFERLLRRAALDDESGQDLLEYGLLVALIALVAVGAVTTVGTTINGVFWTYIAGVMSGI